MKELPLYTKADSIEHYEFSATETLAQTDRHMMLNSTLGPTRPKIPIQEASVYSRSKHDSCPSLRAGRAIHLSFWVRACVCLVASLHDNEAAGIDDFVRYECLDPIFDLSNFATGLS